MQTLHDSRVFPQRDSLGGEIDELVSQIRAVARDVCLGDLPELACRVTGAGMDESLSEVLMRMHTESSTNLCVCPGETGRATIVPLSRIEQEMATPFGQAIFMKRSVAHFLEATGFECTRLSHAVTIGVACGVAISREEAVRNDPVLVLEPDNGNDWAVSVQTLLLVQSSLLRSVLSENEHQRAEVSQAQRAGEALQSELSVASRKAALSERAMRAIHMIGSTLSDLRGSMSEDDGAAVDKETAAALGRIEEIVEQSHGGSEELMIIEDVSCPLLWREAELVERDLLDGHGIEIVEKMGECPLIRSDHRLLLRMLVTLLSNSRRSIVERGCQLRRVELSTESVVQSGVEGVRLTLCDAGAVLDDDASPGVFASGPEQEGVDLTAGIVRRLGGAIWGEMDDSGRGALLHIFLPMSAPEAGRSFEDAKRAA